MSSFHVSNFGCFGGGLPSDLNGFCHTTEEDWLAAPLDWGNEFDDDGKREYCRELAAEARQAITVADAELTKWRRGDH